MKRALALLLVFVMMFSLAACKNEPEPTDPPVADTTPVGTDDPLAMEFQPIHELVIALGYKVMPNFGVYMLRHYIGDVEEIKTFAGLEGDDLQYIDSIAIIKPMQEFVPYSVVLVEVLDEANAQTVADLMNKKIVRNRFENATINDEAMTVCGKYVLFAMMQKGVASDYTAEGICATFEEMMADYDNIHFPSRDMEDAQHQTPNN